ncbi:hypothetical protein [Geoalkalibacter subterraneus]|uniref:Uncharacterized protein n=1 Tax=Geoalkalibacter subterraneus TaxID=483547 RepID=A0A0B5FNC5_9BACT|nr:hypothetical protein [Geoalkalibacter subterraneus]AJF06104.1 hypothetical protein GSUB_05335 [Geoalkalibacter subterraneus]
MINKRQALEQIGRLKDELRDQLIEDEELRHIFLGLHRPEQQIADISERINSGCVEGATEYGLKSYFSLLLAETLLYDDEAHFDIARYSTLLAGAAQAKIIYSSETMIGRTYAPLADYAVQVQRERSRGGRNSRGEEVDRETRNRLIVEEYDRLFSAGRLENKTHNQIALIIKNKIAPTLRDEAPGQEKFGPKTYLRTLKAHGKF